MTDLELLIHLHLPNPRQGPGSDACTRRALALAGLDDRTGLEVADLGCGTGASTLVLAEALDAHITAVDLLPAFLDALVRRAEARGVAGRITPHAASFDALPFAPGSLDLVWSEGAIYNLGFEAGVAAWKELLRPGGVLAVSDLTWLTADPPRALRQHWEAEYPEVAPASARLAVLEAHGLTPIGYFPLPVSSWLEHYYAPLRARFPDFLATYGHAAAARAIVDAELREIDLYERHTAHISYGFYIARKAEVGGAPAR